MKKAPQKRMGYFDVLEALQKAKVCALCELEARSMRRYLDNLLYENVNVFSPLHARPAGRSRGKNSDPARR